MTTFNLQLTSDKGQISVLQLTDSHLFAEESEKILGVRTAELFTAVLKYYYQSIYHL